MQYGDMTLFCADLASPLAGFFNVGWLGGKTKLPEASVLDSDIEQLKNLIFLPAFRSCHFRISRGFASCPVCNDGGLVTSVIHGETRMLGDFLILLPSLKRGEYFVSPSLILHYVEFHGYKPPKVYIDSLRALNEDDAISAASIINDAVSNNAG